MKILSNKKYKEMLKYKNDVLELKKAIEKNSTHQENVRKILEKNLTKEKEKVCSLKIQLEDIQGFLEQEKQVSTQLRKERAYLKRLLTKHKIVYKKESENKKNEK